ncbi:hypothetical protein OROGR_003598 [Orobanche gracilis]
MNSRRRSRRKISESNIYEYLGKKAVKKAIKSAKLNEGFVWRKKIVRDVSQGVMPLSVKAEKKRRRERMAEIEKVKRRREERVIQKSKHEDDMALLARERSAADGWEKKEQEFQFHQSQLKSQIRIREGRMKPIDMFRKLLISSDDMDIEININQPCAVFKGLTVEEMEELHDAIKLCLDFDRAHIQYWEALLVVCDWELTQSRKKDALVDQAQQQLRGGHERIPSYLLVQDRGLHPSVEPDVEDLLQAKTYGELAKFQTHIESEMRSGTAKVVEYWEVVLQRLHIFKAIACLNEFHAQLLRKHLVRLQKPSNDKDTDQRFEEKGVRDLSPEPIEGAGSFSPQLLHCDDTEDAIDPDEDRSILIKKRIAVRRNQEMASQTMPEHAVYGSTEEVNVGDLAESGLYCRHDKYQPRKPIYFSRVHIGYAWNKYNQTHYDHNSPPPTTVRGYKFNIFYPDLVDKSRAPSYFIEKDDDRSETCIIRFHAAPPYEDIAFRIVNKDWEYSNKKGYKCTFERGILHLSFNFKRYSYRR